MDPFLPPRGKPERNRKLSLSKDEIDRVLTDYLTPFGAEAEDKDLDLARGLLCGAVQETADKKKFLKKQFLSSDTKPTEREARAGLARVVMREEVLPIGLRQMLAAHIDPRSNYGVRARRRFEFVRTTTRDGADKQREYKIADAVVQLMWIGLSYEPAVRKVAKKFGFKQSSQVKKIYKKWRARVELDNAAWWDELNN
jgi:hypothetical protein